MRLYKDSVYIINHPLVQHKLSLLRDYSCPTQEFRRLTREITILMGYEATRNLPLEETIIKTPIMEMKAKVLDGKKQVIVPILRAGLGMSDGMLQLLPSARIGHIGIYRHPETHKAVEYLVKLPNDIDRRFYLLDPMLATGNSLIHAVNVLLKRGIKRENINCICIVAAPEGIDAFLKAHEGINLYLAAVDQCLNERDYIVPGLGDAGDRLFGTK